MAENQAPATPATPAAPTTPTIEAKPSLDAQIPVETKTTETATPVTEAKVEAAAEKTGAEQVAKDKRKLKVDGEILTLNEAEMVKWAQMGKAGQKRMQEAIEFQKETKSNWEKLQKALKEDPASVLEDPEIGLNRIELAKKWLADKLQDDQKSPEQKELETLRAENARIKKEKEDSFKKQQEEAHQRETEANIKAIETEMLSAFKKYQLPNSSAMVDRMTGIMEVAEKNNIQVSVDDVAKIVRDEIRKDFQELANLLPEEEFENFIGENVTKRVKENTLRKTKNTPKVDITEVAKNIQTSAAPKPKMSVKDFIKPDWAK